MDYIFRYLSLKFIGAGEEAGGPAPPVITPENAAADEEQMEIPFADPVTEPEPLVGKKVDEYISSPVASHIDTEPIVAPSPQLDAPSCSNCGSIMFRSGACYSCANCGNTSGCG
jgi:ribonucleoside-diphosphate reductase alpha chain